MKIPKLAYTTEFKARAVKRIKDGQSVGTVCKSSGALNVSISRDRAWTRGQAPNRKRLTDSQRLTLIRSIPGERQGAYGSPRRVREPRASGFSARKERGERLLCNNGIDARQPRAGATAARTGCMAFVTRPRPIKASAFEYIEVFYHRKRQHSTLGDRSPIPFLENGIREQHQEKPGA